MRSITIVSLAFMLLVACGKQDEKRGDPPGAASQAKADHEGGQPASPHVGQVAQLVVADLASNAFGNRKIEPGCVAVSDAAASQSGGLVVAAHLKQEPGCGDDEFLWIFSQEKPGAGWDEGFLGPRPACWKGVPDEIADAVAKASNIPRC